MFPSAGYFRGVSCPFFEHGLCHRPHCHYRHRRSRPASKPSSRQPPKLRSRLTPLPTSQQKKERPHHERTGEVAAGKETLAQLETIAKSAEEDQPSQITLAVSEIANFYGSNKDPESSQPGTSSQDSEAKATDAPVTQSELSPIDVCDLPMYVPERCIASEIVYATTLTEPGKPAASNGGERAASKDTLDSVSVERKQSLTEQDVFGSSDELCSDNDIHDGDNDIHESPERHIPSEQELTNIQAEFQRATTAHSQEGKADSRKRRQVDEDPPSTGMKRRRTAHPNAPATREPAPIQSKPRVTSNFSSSLDPEALYMGKKRMAKPTAEPNPAKRPKLPLTPNAKIPTHLRQKFLDSLINEHIKMAMPPEEACQLALDEERKLFDRSRRKMIYLNVSTIALKRLRTQAERFLQEQRERSDARVEALGITKEEGEGGQSLTSPDGVRVERSKEQQSCVPVEEEDGGRHSVAVLKSPDGVRGKKKKKLQLQEEVVRGGEEGGGGEVVARQSTSVPSVRIKKHKARQSSSHSPTKESHSEATHRHGESRKKRDLQLNMMPEEERGAATSLPESQSPTSGREGIKTSRFYSPPERSKPLLASHSERQKSKVRLREKEARERKGKIKSQSTSDKPIKVRPPSYIDPLSAGEDSRVEKQGASQSCIDLTTELFGDSDSGDGGKSPTHANPGSEDDNMGGVSFESALCSIDNSTAVTGKRVRQRGREAQAARPSKILKLKSPSMEQVKTVGKKHSPTGGGQQLETQRQLSSEEDTRLTAGDNSGMPLESPGPSHHPPLPLINLSRLAASIQGREGSSSNKPHLKSHRRRRKKLASPPQPKLQPKPSFTIFKKKEVSLTAPLFYSRLEQYLLTEEQLEENGYPRPTGQGGVATINRKGESPPDIQPVGPNAMRHRCCRCNTPFIIYNSGQYQSVEECVYHFGRLIKTREYGEGMVSVYSCCRERRDSAGCQVTKMHVTAGARPSQDSGYRQTSPPPPSEGHCPAVFALDCEMCYTTRGLQLTRVSVVDMELNPVFESLVKPSHPIVDYNTRFSGLTSENFVGVETTLEQVQQQLLWMVHTDTILLGHSLESDLIALKLVHSRVVDTAVVFPHRKGPPYKRALKTLMGEFLQRIIQDNIDGGHDSLEDSRACMELMLWKVKADLQKTTRRVSTEKQPESS